MIIADGNGEVISFVEGDSDEITDGEVDWLVEKEIKISSIPQQLVLKDICADNIYVYKKHSKLIIEYFVKRKAKIISVKST